MATLLREFGDDYSIIFFQYEEDEVESLPSWGGSFEPGEMDDFDQESVISIGHKGFLIFALKAYRYAW